MALQIIEITPLIYDGNSLILSQNVHLQEPVTDAAQCGIITGGKKNIFKLQ